MKLTKDERYTAYCIMLAEAGRYDNRQEREYYLGNDTLIFPTVNGLCYMYHEIFGSYDLYDFAVELLPELYTKSNSKKYLVFNDWPERIAALKQCIIETHP